MIILLTFCLSSLLCLAVLASKPLHIHLTAKGHTSTARQPSHSIPPHLVAKAAAELGDDAFHRIHDALLKAYFSENRDISSESTLRSIWDECGLDAREFDRSRNPEHLKLTIDQHNEALSCGANGAPAFRLSHIPAAIVGAHPVETLSRWVKRSIDGEI